MQLINDIFGRHLKHTQTHQEVGFPFLLVYSGISHEIKKRHVHITEIVRSEDCKFYPILCRKFY